MPDPTVSTVHPGTAFADALARGLMDRAGGAPLALGRMTVLLPTRRACRTLQEAFLRQSGGRALLLPQLRPLGDTDDDELVLAHDDVLGDHAEALQAPAISGLRRHLLLTRLVRRFGEAREQAPAATVDQAARLAAELGRLLDQVETEGLDFDGLAELVPADYAEHWQITLQFLQIVTDWWPKQLAAERATGPAERRRRLMRAQAAAWRRDPPADPVIAAGSTGSIPATAELLDTVARLPHGEVVLPGLDRGADDASWTEILADPTHPQHNMARLLDRMGVDRRAVGDWPAGDGSGARVPAARIELVNAALKPADTTPQWRSLAARGDPERLRLALVGVTRIEAPGPGEEAAAIALALRQALEVPGRTAALVTPDRALARRVSAELQRWDLRIDDSAGVPLADTAPGTFLRLTAQLLAEDLAPLPLLAALKHPMAAGGGAPGAFKERLRRLEMRALRGVRPAPGLQGLRDALDADDRARGKPPDRDLRAWLDGVERLAAEALAVLRRPEAPLGEAVAAHMRFAEALAESDAEPGARRLWAHDAGEQAAAFAAELARTADAAPPVEGARYPALLDTLMAGLVVRPRFGGHPRLAIWGPLEARLQRADLMILGGLNEGTWPAETDPGPWMSRPMRTDFGLPPVERRIGLMAHDFAQAFAAPEVMLTRATRVEGTPTVPSRWLLRLEALLEAYGLSDTPLQIGDPSWVRWARALDQPDRIRPVAPPAPTPPAEARPQRLSVTRVETWMRDPYDLYADQVLGLRALDPLDQDPGAAEHGTLIHAVLEAFAREAAESGLPGDIAGRLNAIAAEQFDRLKVRPGMRAFWAPRFRRIARWLAAEERARRADGRQVLPECKGALEVAGGRGRLTLTAKADRIERLPDGALAILDYKTGSVPSAKQVDLGFAPQLPLEAVIAAHGGFAGVPAAATRELAYWRLTGGETPGEARRVDAKRDADTLAEAALDGLRGLIDAFADPGQPFHARPRPAWVPRYSDYDHLARVQEWSAGPGGDDP